ncbi:MAG: penicillin-binding protein activator [Acidiferrobacter sp.]
MTSRPLRLRVARCPKTAALIVLAAVALSGCASLNIATAPRPRPPSAEHAQRAAHEGHYMQAALAYQQLAQDHHGVARADFALKASDALVHAGALRAAAAELRLVHAPLPNRLAARRAVLAAEIAAASDEPAHALADARQAARSPGLQPRLLAEIHRIEAQAALRLGHPLVTARELVDREGLLVSRRRLANNERALWHALAMLPSTRLQRVRDKSHRPALRAWADLALRARRYPPQSQRLVAAIQAWQNRYPHDQPTRAFLASLTGARRRPIGLIHTIAVLLPLSSPFAAAAKAVENGFVDMSTARPLPSNPHIVIYDIGSDPHQASHYYNEAVRRGAQFIVGPLGADSIRNVVDHAQFRVPTLLLGLAPGPIADDVNHVPVYQFSLARTLEARQVADRAYLDGHRRAAILYPNTAWGHRMRKAFARRWRHLGGLVVVQTGYTPGQNTYTQPVEQLLNITESRQRAQRLQRILGMPLAFTARRRQDVGFVFLVTDAPDGRLIKPQLDYDHADHLPVYSTSSVFTGRPDPVYDRDLDGIVFGDMPWMLVANGRMGRLRASLPHAHQYEFTPLARLFAFGADADGLIARLDRLSLGGGGRYNGLTGALSIKRNGVIHRQLVWAQFTHGLPQLIDTFLPYQSLFAKPTAARAGIDGPSSLAHPSP